MYVLVCVREAPLGVAIFGPLEAILGLSWSYPGALESVGPILVPSGVIIQPSVYTKAVVSRNPSKASDFEHPMVREDIAMIA